jgi:hypothetical protein
MINATHSNGFTGSIWFVFGTGAGNNIHIQPMTRRRNGQAIRLTGGIEVYESEWFMVHPSNRESWAASRCGYTQQ